MSNHTHEVYSVTNQRCFSEAMRRHHGRYGLFFNRRHRRSGKVAEGRPKTCLMGDDRHAMRTTFYIHANPLRARMVKDMRQYLWSTHLLYAFGKRLPWMVRVTLPSWYLALGTTPAVRQRRYRKLFDAYLRENGLIKRDYFNRPFCGPGMWVLSMQRSVQDWIKARAAPGGESRQNDLLDEPEALPLSG